MHIVRILFLTTLCHCDIIDPEPLLSRNGFTAKPLNTM